jgi:hypothetical protein
LSVPLFLEMPVHKYVIVWYLDDRPHTERAE